MQKKTNTDNCREYFAAANGYGGFRSYFPEIFKSSDYEKLYILKGGPGTGKSSLMREVADFGIKNGYYCEKILCSSDPHSLDGVILEKGKKRFAVLDGTAPHTRDTDVPGACDEIINLGENWNDEQLLKNRSLIFELNERKKNNYKLAYEHLGYAGKIKEIKTHLILPSIRWDILKSAAKDAAESILKNERLGKRDIRLVSSYGCFGLFSLNTAEQFADETITVKRCEASEAYMSVLYRELCELGVKMTVFPSVFDGDEIEALFLPETKTAVIFTESDTADVYPMEFFRSNPNITVPNELTALYQAFMLEAKKFFTFASDMHFELEKIYIGSMNFSSNSTFLKKITDKIKNTAV